MRRKVQGSQILLLGAADATDGLCGVMLFDLEVEGRVKESEAEMGMDTDWNTNSEGNVR
jgi:hypothetical protein